MAKTVFFVRHAKSSWSDPTLADVKRPLNKRGLRDAPFMAALISKQVQGPFRLISSPAVRARKTAGYFAAACGLSEQAIQIEQRLYLAAPATILTVVQELPGEEQILFVFGHNPGFTELVRLFSTDDIENVPTCGILEVHSAAQRWQDFSTANARLVRFLYPKQYFGK